MRALVLTLHNPLNPSARDLTVIRRPLRVRKLQPPRAAWGYYALLNGRPLLRAGWRRRLRHGDTLAFVPVLANNGGGSNPLRMILSLALMAFAPMAAGAFLGASAGTALIGSFTLGQAVSLGVVLAGNALINAVFPAQSGPAAFSMPQASPTYSLTAQGNAARLEQPIPVQYGRMKFYPDFAEPPWAEFASNDQFLNVLLCLGQGHFEVEDILIEDTPISAFGEVETQVIEPGGAVTLFPTAVVTSVEVSGMELPGRTSGTFAKSGSVATVTETNHGRVVGQAVNITFASGASTWQATYAVATVPTADTFTVADTVVTAASGTANIRSILGGQSGFVASAAGDVATYLALDMVAPSGIFATGASALESLTVGFAVEARQIDELGQPIGNWFSLGVHEIEGRTPTAIRRTFRYQLATPGRYAVRVWRDTPASSSSNASDDLYVGSLRAYVRRPLDYGNVTLLAVRMRATNNLSGQASRRIAVIGTRKLPVWTGSAWSAPQATTSIAWAIADAAKNVEYGAGLTDAQINLDQLAALDSLWSARGDAFNARFDTSASWWDQVNRIAAAGRAQIYMQGGILQVVRDGPATVPVALFSMQNIRRGSFGVDYLQTTSATADTVELTFWDARVWKPNRITCRVAGSSAARPVKSDGFGIDNLAQAQREGTYRAAANRYHRTLLKFETEMDGFIPSPGDLIAVQHDLVAWGQVAEVIGWDAVERRATLSVPMVWTDGATHYIGLRRIDGSVSGPWRVTRVGADNVLAFDDTLDFTPYTGLEMDRTHAAFGPGSSWSGLAKIASMRPRGTRHILIEAVAYDEAVHLADQGLTPRFNNRAGLGRVPTRPIVTDLRARTMPDNPSRAVFSWQPAPGADTYQIEMAEGADPNEAGLVWTRVADTTASDIVATLLFANNTVVRVRAMGLTAGPWVTASLGALLDLFWHPNPAALFWNPDPNSLFWSA